MKNIHRIKNEKEDMLIVSCRCGCGDTVVLEIDQEDIAFMTYYNSNWGREQAGPFGLFREKIRKIWRIICNKDHHYSDIMLTNEGLKEFRDYINDVYEKVEG